MFAKINHGRPMPVDSSLRRGGAFTLVEIMIVVAIIALLAAIALPGFLRARKRSQATKVLTDLRLIDSAVDQYALEQNRVGGSPVSVADWTQYIKVNTRLYLTARDVFDQPFSSQTVDSIPQVPPATKASLSDVADDTFWSPFR